VSSGRQVLTLLREIFNLILYFLWTNSMA
jgi:hypothetical protein